MLCCTVLRYTVCTIPPRKMFKIGYVLSSSVYTITNIFVVHLLFSFFRLCTVKHVMLFYILLFSFVLDKTSSFDVIFKLNISCLTTFSKVFINFINKLSSSCCLLYLILSLLKILILKRKNVQRQKGSVQAMLLFDLNVFELFECHALYNHDRRTYEGEKGKRY